MSEARRSVLNGLVVLVGIIFIIFAILTFEKVAALLSMIGAIIVMGLIQIWLSKR